MDLVGGALTATAGSAAAWNALAEQARAQLASEGFSGTRARIQRSAALHYKGQSYELVVPVPDGAIDERMVAVLEEAFAAEHERTYGHRAGPEEPIELVALQVVGSGLREERACPSGSSPPGPSRESNLERCKAECAAIDREMKTLPAEGPADKP